MFAVLHKAVTERVYFYYAAHNTLFGVRDVQSTV